MVSTLKMALKHIHFPYLPDLDADFLRIQMVKQIFVGINTDFPILDGIKTSIFPTFWGPKIWKAQGTFLPQAMALTSLQVLPAEKLQKALPAVKQGILKRCHGEELEELQLNGGDSPRRHGFL